MSVDECREKINRLLRNQPRVEDCTNPEHLSPKTRAATCTECTVDAILDLELLPGITLKRIVELKDKLVVLDDDQSFPAFGFTTNTITGGVYKAAEEMQKHSWRHISPLGEKEG